MARYLKCGIDCSSIVFAISVAPVNLVGFVVVKKLDISQYLPIAFCSSFVYNTFFSGKFYSHIYIIQKLEIKKPALHELYHASTEQSEFSIQTKYCVDDVLRLWIFTRSSVSLSLWNQMSVPINMLLNIAKRKIPL